MFVDLKLSGRNAIVFSPKEGEARYRSKQLLDEGAKVTLFLTEKPTKKIRKFAKQHRIDLLSGGFEELFSILRQLNPSLVVVSTEKEALDRKVATLSRSVGAVVYVVDRPHLSDLSMVALARIGDVRVGISTNGLSPAMSAHLRRRVESLITFKDVQQVRLQGEIRGLIKRSISNSSTRRNVIHRLMQDERIASLLETDKFEEARRHALNLLDQFAERPRQQQREVLVG
ncbi:MAG: bifunctional precorrin-2 dehydrogenase/sirohydrochlorin ferrochelatase [Nitrososphaerota archaeon]|nr:bifunctional precorrin-2 dehydrogenase/sirohydrochlorin ferrochelatase [Nitrososphaerota archaeon]